MTCSGTHGIDRSLLPDAGASIRAVGAYAPRYRIGADAVADAWGRFEGAGIEETAVPGPDEDSLTMAGEAGRLALAATDDGDGRSRVPPASIDWLGFATTTPPVAEADLTARLASFLGVNESVEGTQFGGSTRAGTRALWAAMDAVGSESSERALVVAADAPRGEPESAVDHAAGAGAAAIVLGPNQEGGARIVDRASITAPSPGTRFRERGSTETTGLGATTYDRGAFVEAVGRVADRVDRPSGPDAVALQASNGKLQYRAAGVLGVDTERIETCATVHDLGDLGAASVPVSLAAALADDHGTILGIGYGSGGGADAFVLERDEPVSTRLELAGEVDIDYATYCRYRGTITAGPPEGGGAYVSAPSWRRSLPQRHRLEAGRCRSCGALAFPPEGACPACAAVDGYDDVSLSREGVVRGETAIARGGAPPEFAPLQSRGGEYAALLVELEPADRDDAAGGPKGDDTVTIPAMGTGAEASSFEAGSRVRATVRRLYRQEGVPRYGVKFEPSEG